MNWCIPAAFLVLSVLNASAQTPINVNILPSGRVQFIKNGPELDARTFRRALLKLKQETSVREIHLYSRSDASMSHEPEIFRLIKAAGFKVIAVD
jgi:hypothetical protein